MSCDRSHVCDIAAELGDLFVNDWLVEFQIFLKNHTHIAKRKHLAIFLRF